MRARFAVLAAFAVGCHVTARAQAAGFGPIVLQLPASTRAIGFGNAYVGVRDPEAVFYNPAQLGVRPGVAMSAERYGSVVDRRRVREHVRVRSVRIRHWRADARLRRAVSAGYPGAAPNGEHARARCPVRRVESRRCAGARDGVQGNSVGADGEARARIESVARATACCWPMSAPRKRSAPSLSA